MVTDGPLYAERSPPAACKGRETPRQSREAVTKMIGRRPARRSSGGEGFSAESTFDKWGIGGRGWVVVRYLHEKAVTG